MRLGVLDVGSNTVHLLIVDAHVGACPRAAAEEKSELHLASLIAADGSLSTVGVDRLAEAVAAARSTAARLGANELLAFATSAVRDASNAVEVLEQVHDRTGVHLRTVSGEDEARLTFLAVRRWFGWSGGRLLAVDIGGGSLEVAAGADEWPEVALSVPLGAGRLTHMCLPGDPPTPAAVKDLRRFVRHELSQTMGPVLAGGAFDRAVATSKTFRSLARIAGAAPVDGSPLARGRLARNRVREIAHRLAQLTAAQRASLPGVSTARAGQLLAGAIIAEEVLAALELDEVELCPWALREGVILRRLDALVAAGSATVP